MYIFTLLLGLFTLVDSILMLILQVPCTIAIVLQI